MNILLLTSKKDIGEEVANIEFLNNSKVIWCKNESEISLEQIPDIIIADYNFIVNSEIFIKHFRNSHVPVIVIIDDLLEYYEEIFENIVPYQVIKYPFDINFLKLNILTAYIKSNEFAKLTKRNKEVKISHTPIIDNSNDVNFYQNQILRSKFLYYSSLNALFEAIFVIDEDLNIILENNAWKKFKQQLGIDQVTLGETIDILAKKFKGFKISEYILALKLGDTFIEKDVEVKPGLYCEIYKSPIKDENDYVSRVITVIKDTTDYHKAQEIVRKSEKSFVNLWNFYLK